MIPRDFITEWRAEAPWTSDLQVEQDLVLSRTIAEVFGSAALREKLAFRGGTALYKLILKPPARYSEDIDLVQTTAEPIGAVLDSLRAVLDSWLGKPRRDASEGNVTLIYRAQSEGLPPVPLRIKIEINSREHFTVLGHETYAFAVSSRWFTGRAEVRSYKPEELLATKLRALYQRRKGRDLFDLWYASSRTQIDPNVVVRVLLEYLKHEGLRVSRAEFEENLASKLDDPRFAGDMVPLLASGVSWNIADAARYVMDELVARFPGAPWKGKPPRGSEEP